MNRIALAAKRHWEYPDEWIDAWRGALTITPDQLQSWTVLVARDSAVRAFAAVDLRASPAFLEHMWVDPACMRSGLGALLFAAVRREAVAAGHQALHTDSDPNAVGFYVAMGGLHTEDIAAPVLRTARTLPRVEFDLIQ